MARPQSPDYDDRRQAILDAAARLFAEQGFHSASVAKIADACGTSKALIYHYFAAKEDLLFAVMADHVRLLKETAENIAAKGGAPEDTLRAVARAFLNIYQDAGARHVVLLNELKSLEPGQRDEIVAIERDILASFDGLIGEIGTPALTDKARRTVATRLFMGMINWTYTWFEAQGPISADQVADMATETFITGLREGNFDRLGEKSDA